MNLQSLMSYLDAHVHRLDYLGDISTGFTCTGISFEKDGFPEEPVVNFQLPWSLLATILKSYRRQAKADPDMVWDVPLKGIETYLMQFYGVGNLMEHVLSYTRLRKLDLLAE
jgi:hypothetical protein